MMKIIRNIKNRWDMMRPDDQVAFVLGVAYIAIIIVILILGLYVKIWE